MSEDDLFEIKLDEKCVIKLTNENKNDIIERNAKQACKVLRISSKLDIHEVTSALKPLEYPNLFILIIEEQDLNFLSENHEAVEKFGAARPLIIHQICEAENESKFYYKRKNSSQIVDIDQYYSEDYELYEKWSNEIYSLDDRELHPFEDKMLKKLSCIKDSSIFLRFLRTLSIQQACLGSIVLKVAENGSKADLWAVLDASYDGNGRILNNQAQNYIKNVFKDVQREVEPTLEEPSVLVEDDPMDGTSSPPENSDLSQSVLLTAIQHSNQEIIDYLVTYCSHLIQQLPVKHQIKISTTAFDKNHFDVLCDLLEYSDFPFPEDFSTKERQVSHERLHQITNERSQLEVAISEDNFKEIDEFIENNQNLKFVFNIDNDSLLTQAVILEKFGVFYYLKSLGFQGENCENVLKNLNDDDKKKAEEQASKQKRTNIKMSLKDCHKSVWHLSARSSIHNRKISKKLEAEYREKIRSWFKDIQKIAPEMLDVAASCEDLKIIFDFESLSVENVSLANPNSSGSTNTRNKWIFIGSKFKDMSREQKIKGVLAHELCHNVVDIVYENQEFPYFKGDERTEGIFKKIVADIDKWSITNNREPDDKCNGIISKVYRLYPSKEFVSELIVRVVNILAHYDDDSEKIKLLQGMYKILFDFWYKHVVPDLKTYCEKNQAVIRLNGVFEHLQKIRKQQIEFSSPKDMTQLTENKITIVKTNVPTLLFINIHKHLQEICGGLLDSQNLFVDLKYLKSNQQNQKDFGRICTLNSNLNIFVDCSKEVPKLLSNIFVSMEVNYILIVSTESQCQELKDMTAVKKLDDPFQIDLPYKWMDLDSESQKRLLESKINFQNDSNLSLCDILVDGMDLELIIDTQVLNMLVDKQKISINSQTGLDSIGKHFEFMFQARKFVDRNKDTIISQKKLLSNVKNKQYVLISDTAGTGKSWIMKNISKVLREQNPTRWMTYVDLKQFINEFRDEKNKPEFLTFFIQNILKLESQFEIKVFINLYKSGKVCILLDGFDEIAPDFAEFVANLAHLFEFNEGNQMWIATRDNFQIDLLQKLPIDGAYKLDKFTEQDGINFIVASWVLSDINTLGNIKTKSEFDKEVRSSQKFTKYQQKARQIVRKVTMYRYNNIGLPQLFKMIADGFKNDKYTSRDLNGSKIFSKFAQQLYKKWTQETGQVRTEASIKCHENGLNFWRLHHFLAVENLFPELVEVLFPDFDISDWPVEEIIACGFMTKIGENFFFLHETFREYFLVDFIVKALTKQKIDGKIVEMIVKILTNEKFKIVQWFLNDAIEDRKVLDKIQPEMQKHVDHFYSLDYFTDFYKKNFENLAYLLISVLKNGDYDKVKELLQKNAKDILAGFKELNIILMFQEFLVDFLNVEDLKKLMINEELFHEIIGSSNNIEAFDDLATKIESKIGCEFVQQGLKQMSSDTDKGNIFWFLCTSQNISVHKVQKFLKIVQKFLSISEIMQLIEIINQKEQNVFEFSAEYVKNFGTIWEGCMDILRMDDALPAIKRILKKLNWENETLLHSAAEYQNLKFHENLWEILLKAVDKQDEINEIIFQKNSYDINLLHNYVAYNTPDVIDFTLKKLKDILSDSDYYHQILRSKGQFGRNLLQLAANQSKEVKTHQMLWQELQKSCTSNKEFLEILREVDEDGDNVLHHAASSASGKVFKFMIAELEKLKKDQEAKKFYKKLGCENSNLLQAAAQQNKYLELHEVLWESLEKYFDLSEILQFIKHRDVYGKNVLLNVIDSNTKAVKELTWNKVKKILIKIGCEDNESIKKCDEILKNDKNIDDLTAKEEEFLKLDWIKSDNSVKLFEDNIQMLIQKPISDISLKDLKLLIANKKLEKHEILWKYLKQNRTNNYEEIRRIFLEKDDEGDNFLHLLVNYNTADVIEFTIKKFKKHLNKLGYHEILRSKGQFGRNLLQIAACCSTEIKTHQILYQVIRNSCKSDEFLEILAAVDEHESNVLHLGVSLATSEVFEFMIAEIENLTCRDEIRKFLTKLGPEKTNLLQAASKSEYLELHKSLWKIIYKYFTSFEILEFIKHSDRDGDNLLIIGTKCSTKEVLELTWTEVEKVLTILYTDNETVVKIKECEKIIQKIAESKNKSEEKDKEIDDEESELLKLEWIKSPNPGSSNLFNESNLLKNNLTFKTIDDLMQIVETKNVLDHQKLWKPLLKTFKNQPELKMLLFEELRGNNFIHHLVTKNNADVIEFTLNKRKIILSHSKYNKILRSKGHLERNLLQCAAANSDEVKTHQILWKELQKSCKSNEEFLKLLEEVDGDGNNVVHLAASFTTAEVFAFMILEIEKLANSQQIRKLLSSFGQANSNLFQSVATQNESLETNKTVWEIICKYFEPEEILKFIEHCNKDRDHLLCNAVYFNTKEIVEFTWNQIKLYIDTKNAQFEYLKRRGKNGQNLDDMSLKNHVNDSQVALWVQKTLNEYEI